MGGALNVHITTPTEVCIIVLYKCKLETNQTLLLVEPIVETI